MAFTIIEALEVDMERAFEIASLAFGRAQPFWNVTYPNHWTPAGRQSGARNFQETKRSDPFAKYVKAIDNASGRMVGFAKWCILVNTVPDFSKISKYNQESDADERKAYQQYLTTQFFAERRDAITMSNGNIVCVDLLAVDPSYQRRGVASALIAWGAQRADDLGFDSVVESSAAGQGVYERHGFFLVKKVQIHVPPKWASHREGQDYAWLVRPKNSWKHQRSMYQEASPQEKSIGSSGIE